jgi:hypothetical protein
MNFKTCGLWPELPLIPIPTRAGLWSVRVPQAGPGCRLPGQRDDRLLLPGAEITAAEDSSSNRGHAGLSLVSHADNAKEQLHQSLNPCTYYLCMYCKRQLPTSHIRIAYGSSMNKLTYVPQQIGIHT